jgi:hypothetical protein
MLQMQPKIQRCKHDMIHRWKCNMHMYITLPTEAQKGKTTRKVDFWSTRHCAKSASEKSGSEREEDAEYQRPSSGVYREDPLDGLPMWSPRRRLKTSAQTHRKLDVQPRRRQVQEGANHALVLLLVHELSILVRIERCSRTHRCCWRWIFVNLAMSLPLMLALIYYSNHWN